MVIEFLLIVLGGMFCVVAAYYDWDWFMTSYRVRFLVRLMGRSGTRLFYALFGSFFTAYGVIGFILK